MPSKIPDESTGASVPRTRARPMEPERRGLKGDPQPPLDLHVLEFDLPTEDAHKVRPEVGGLAARDGAPGRHAVEVGPHEERDADHREDTREAECHAEAAQDEAAPVMVGDVVAALRAQRGLDGDLGVARETGGEIEGHDPPTDGGIHERN